MPGGLTRLNSFPVPRTRSTSASARRGHQGWHSHHRGSDTASNEATQDNPGSSEGTETLLACLATARRFNSPAAPKRVVLSIARISGGTLGLLAIMTSFQRFREVRAGLSNV